MILSDLHLELQRFVVRAVDEATGDKPAFLRRVPDYAQLPAEVRQAIVVRLGHGGWGYVLQGGDLVITGGMK